MKNIRYTRPSEERHLSAADLTSLGVEDAEENYPDGFQFKPDESVPVDDDVAEILMNNVVGLRESTDDELKSEEEQLEAELGFKMYDPTEHNVDEVLAEMAVSPENRRQYILKREREGQARKTILDQFRDTSDADMELAEAGGTSQESTGEPGIGGMPATNVGSGRASTA